MHTHCTTRTFITAGVHAYPLHVHMCKGGVACKSGCSSSCDADGNCAGGTCSAFINACGKGFCGLAQFCGADLRCHPDTCSERLAQCRAAKGRPQPVSCPKNSTFEWCVATHDEQFSCKWGNGLVEAKCGSVVSWGFEASPADDKVNGEEQQHTRQRNEQQWRRFILHSHDHKESPDAHQQPQQQRQQQAQLQPQQQHDQALLRRSLLQMAGGQQGSYPSKAYTKMASGAGGSTSGGGSGTTIWSPIRNTLTNMAVNRVANWMGVNTNSLTDTSLSDQAYQQVANAYNVGRTTGLGDSYGFPSSSTSSLASNLGPYSSMVGNLGSTGTSGSILGNTLAPQYGSGVYGNGLNGPLDTSGMSTVFNGGVADGGNYNPYYDTQGPGFNAATTDTPDSFNNVDGWPQTSNQQGGVALVYIDRTYWPDAPANVTYPCPDGYGDGMQIGPGIPCGIPLTAIPANMLPTINCGGAAAQPSPYGGIPCAPVVVPKVPISGTSGGPIITPAPGTPPGTAPITGAAPPPAIGPVGTPPIAGPPLQPIPTPSPPPAIGGLAPASPPISGATGAPLQPTPTTKTGQWVWVDNAWVWHSVEDDGTATLESGSYHTNQVGVVQGVVGGQALAYMGGTDCMWSVEKRNRAKCGYMGARGCRGLRTKLMRGACNTYHQTLDLLCLPMRPAHTCLTLMPIFP